MNADETIGSYVTDVAVHLPRRQRNDVAFELRALLREELQAKARAAGREADAAMATELLQAFGRPVDVAARYRPTLTIIDPADGHLFLRATVIGLAIIWGAGLLKHLSQPIDSGWDLLGAFSQWWWTAVIPSLWWPGVLVVWFGVASWSRRRWPRTPVWTPRPADRIQGGRLSMVLGVIGILCGLAVLIDPRWLVDPLFGGRAAPAAYEVLTYTETFRQRQAPWLVALILLNVPLLITAFVSGRWSASLRRVEISLGLVTCAVLVWAALDGPVFKAASSDRTAKSLLLIIAAFTLVNAGIRLRRSVKPTPGA